MKPWSSRGEALARSLSDGVAQLLCWLTLVDVTFAELRSGERESRDKAPSQLTLDEAQFLFDQQEASSAHTDEKMRLLLTLSVSLAGFAVAFFKGPWGGWPLTVIVMLLLFSSALTLRALSVRTFALPAPSDESDKQKREISWALDLWSSAQQNRASHQVRVDQYRAASRLLVTALFVTVAVLAVRGGRSEGDTLAGHVDRVVGSLDRLGSRVSVERRSLAPGDSSDFIFNPLSHWSNATPPRKNCIARCCEGPISSFLGDRTRQDR